MIPLSTIPDRVFYSVCYAVFALPLIVFYAFFVPPFQVPDESSHFARAYQLAQGEFFPTREVIPNTSGEYILGGTVDPGIFDAAEYFTYLSFQSDQKVVPQNVAKAYEIDWQQGTMRDTRNVSVYAPTYYATPAVGILLGQSLDLSILESLTLSRLLTGLSAFMLVTLAMLLLERGHGVFFVLLLMPMTLAQIASVSQDALCFASAALCVALLSRLDPELAQRRRRVILILSTILLITLANARPPYVGLSLFYLYFALSFRSHRQFAIDNYVAFAAIWVATILWALYVALFVSVPFGLEGVDYGRQAQYVLQSPFGWLGVLADSLQQRWDFYLYSFIGLVGHLDTAFPPAFYFLVVVALCFAFFMTFMSGNQVNYRAVRDQALVPCLIVLATMVGIFLVLYISWTPLHNPVIEGVQGRYFIPCALFLALATTRGALTGYGQVWYRCMMLAFAVGSLAINPYVVMQRYY